MAFSFNGGKDSTAVLHVLLEAVEEWRRQHDAPWAPEDGLLGLHTFYFEGADEFKEVQDFVMACDRRHHLRLAVYTGAFQPGLERILATTSVKAILMGTRHGDPNCQDQARAHRDSRRVQRRHGRTAC